MNSQPTPNVPAAQAVETERQKVLYIGGTGRTGSTLLDRLLGQVPGWFSGGELAFFWRYGLDADGRCSCGEPVRDCEVWGSVLREAFGSVSAIDSQRMIELRKRFWSVHMPLMVHEKVRQRFLERLEEFPAQVERLYQAVASTTGAQVIIDSSKEPHYSYILRERTDLDIYFLHLVRDPRAVGFSWQRERKETGFAGDAFMETRAPWKSSVYFNVSNIAAEAFWSDRTDRYLQVRYEDFLQAPAQTLADIGQFVGQPVDPSNVLSGEDGCTFSFRPVHSAWGNPNRFSTGTSRVKADEEWRQSLGSVDRLVLSGLTAPVARRYGYSLRAPRPARNNTSPSIHPHDHPLSSPPSDTQVSL